MDEEKSETKGFLAYEVSYGCVRLLADIFALVILVAVIFDLSLIYTAWQLQSHIGYFINMVSYGEGHILPNLQAIPAALFLLLNIAMVRYVGQASETLEPLPSVGKKLKTATIVSIAFIIALLIAIICVIVHAFGEHISFHDGIVSSMKKYLNNLESKMQIDELQVEFQCCGSRKYDEWYELNWYDKSLQKGGKEKRQKADEGEVTEIGDIIVVKANDGNTPFSCCSKKALGPCIHHNIESTGSAYLYTPEYNLSISTRGCYEVLKEEVRVVGQIVAKDLVYLLLIQIICLIMFRYIETAFHQDYMFEDHNNYYMFIMGAHTKRPEPPPIPPLPEELRR